MSENIKTKEKTLPRIRLSFDEPDFQFSREDSKINCVIKSYITFPQQMLPLLSYVDMRGGMWDNAKTRYVFVTHGTAKCHNEDVWDDKKGRHLSESRAKVKAFKKAKYFLKNLMASLVDDATSTALAYSQIDNLYMKERAHIEVLKNE